MQDKKDFKEIYIGIDISKDKFDVYIHPMNQYLSITNNNKGIESFIKQITKLKQTYNINDSDVFVGMEATGRYHKELFKKLSLETDCSISVINPKRIHNFFKSFGDIAKTDKKDAKLIALFMERIKPEPNIFSKEIEDLKSLSTRRRQIISSITAQKNQLEGCGSKNIFIKRSIARVIKVLQKELKEINLFILKLIEENKEWKNKKEILESVPGIGTVSVIELISNLQELGLLNNKEITSLIGVAPKNKDSGKFKGKRSILGGRRDVRNALYMCALSSIRVGNNVFAELYQRLRNKGKCPKVAIIAVVRKLIIILNSMIKQNTKWNNILIEKM